MRGQEKRRVPVIPEGFQELLEALSYDVLKAQPTDVLRFCIENLTKKLNETNTVDSEAFLVPDQGNARRQGVAAESWDPDQMTSYEKVVHAKTDEQRLKLLDSARGLLLFRCLDDGDLNEVVDAMFECKVEAGQDVITIGEAGDNFYIIDHGLFEIYVNIDGELVSVGSYQDNGSFGELALMYNTPRAATIRAATDGALWAMSRETFRAIVLTKAFKKRQLYEELLSRVTLLEALSSYDRTNLADALQDRTVEPGEAVFLQGDIGKEMFFIEWGTIEIRMKGPEVESSEIDLCQLGQNDYFGELALVTQQPRAASAYAKELTRLAVLDVDSFVRILGPCQSLLEAKAEEYAAKLQDMEDHMQL